MVRFSIVFMPAGSVYKSPGLSTTTNTRAASENRTGEKPLFINTCPTHITGLPTPLPTGPSIIFSGLDFLPSDSKQVN